MRREHFAYRIRLTGVCMCASAALVTVTGSHVLAEEEPAPLLEEVTIVGSRDDVRDMPGAAHVVGPEDLARFVYTDIQRMAGQVPGGLHTGRGRLRPAAQHQHPGRGERTQRAHHVAGGQCPDRPSALFRAVGVLFPDRRSHALRRSPQGACGDHPGTLYDRGCPEPGFDAHSLGKRPDRLSPKGGQHGTWRLHATYGGSTDREASGS